MTPRERTLAAIRHEECDRTPRDFWAEPATLKRLLSLPEYPDEESLLQTLGIDVRHLNAVEPAETEVASGLFQNFWGERYIYRATEWGTMREDVQGSLSATSSFEELEAHPFPTPDCLDYSLLGLQCRRWHSHALLYGFADVWQRPALVRGWENWFLDMVDRPEWVHFLSQKFTDFYLEDYARAAEASSGRIDIYMVISDLGSQQGPLISPAMFREFVAPYLKKMVNHIHRLGGYAMFHSCGSVASFIPSLIELGVDILDPIQPTGPEMSPEVLAREFGKDLCFHGGIDMQSILPLGTPEEVQKEAERYSSAFGTSGGYILAPAHLFQPNVPPENIRAVYTSRG